MLDQVKYFRFEFKVKTPDVAGTFKEYFRPVSEYVSWFNDLGIYWEINVTGSGDSDLLFFVTKCIWSIVGQSV
ncbi:MAG: hypothetical protein R3B38_01730 [Patescibacteria group bacterium]